MRSVRTLDERGNDLVARGVPPEAVVRIVVVGLVALLVFVGGVLRFVVGVASSAASRAGSRAC